MGLYIISYVINFLFYLCIDMKIYSKFKDYYDGAGYHSDFPIFIRKQKSIAVFENSGEVFSKSQRALFLRMYSTIPVPKFIYRNPRYKYDFHRMFSSDILIFGICGKLYPVYLIKNIPYIDPVEFVNEYIKINNYIKQTKNYFKEFDYTPDGITAWKKSFNDNEVEELFITMTSPIFMLTSEGCNIYKKSCMVEVNPMLSNIKFQRILDPWSIYQEIEMYLSNILITKDPIGEFDDNLKLSAHGFNCCSFKNCNKSCG